MKMQASDDGSVVVKDCSDAKTQDKPQPTLVLHANRDGTHIGELTVPPKQGQRLSGPLVIILDNSGSMEDNTKHWLH